MMTYKEDHVRCSTVAIQLLLSKFWRSCYSVSEANHSSARVCKNFEKPILIFGMSLRCKINELENVQCKRNMKTLFVYVIDF